MTSLRGLAKSHWAVRDLGQQLMVSSGQFVAYFDVAEDAFVPTEKEHRLPRTAAIAVIGYQASRAEVAAGDDASLERGHPAAAGPVVLRVVLLVPSGRLKQ